MQTWLKPPAGCTTSDTRRDLHDTGFHPLDGARYLRDIEDADRCYAAWSRTTPALSSRPPNAASAADLVREFKPAPRDLADALIYCDMTTGPDGQEMTVRKRIAEVRKRYGPDHVVSRAIARVRAELIAAVGRVEGKLEGRASPHARRC